MSPGPRRLRTPGARVYIAVLVLTLAPGGCETRPAFAAARLVVDSAAGRWSYHVEVASNEQQRHLGLMYRKSMAVNRGMLLWFAHPRRCGIWMKNTYISLDILFIDSTGHITKIVKRAEPLSTRVMDSVTPVRAVLEINGGQAGRRGIRTGDKIIYGPFH